MEVYIKKQDGSFYDITSIFETVTLESSINQFKKIVTLVTVDNKDSPLIPLNPIDLTSELRIVEDGQELFLGMVVTEDEKRRKQKVYTAYDYAWYFENNKESFYFEDTPYDVAIKEIMEYFGLDIRIRITDSSFTVTKLFKTSSIADILNYIFAEYKDKTGKEVDMYIEGTTFDLLPTKRQDYLDGRYQPQTFTVDLFDQTLPFQELITNKNQSRSFENLKNAVKVNSFSKTSFETEADIEDTNSINKYGRLQEVVAFNYDTDEFPESIAKNTLDLLNKESNLLDIEVSKGNVNILSGEVINISDSTLGIDGVFEVNKIKMIWSNSNLSMNLTLDEIN